MTQTLDSGEVVFFGQELEEAEKIFSCQAVDGPLRVARKGIDKIIELKQIKLEFDTGRLRAITFREDYEFKNPLIPYPEEWKNFPAIGNKKIHGRMSRDEFLDYLAAWEKRAMSFGIEKFDLDDFTPKQYAVSFTRDNFVDMLHISMGPTRRAGLTGRGLWCDGWHVSFSMDRGFKAQLKPGLLESLSTFRDEYNTVARK